MSSEEETVISFVFKRSGKDVIPISHFYLTLSMDLKWFSPRESKEFLENAINRNLMVKKGEMISPSFEFKKTIIPLGFRPSVYCLNIGNKKNQGAYENIVGFIKEKTGKSTEQITDEIKIIVERENINLDVAALLFAKSLNIKIDEFFDEIEVNVFKESE
jgi:hypothetical protein